MKTPPNPLPPADSLCLTRAEVAQLLRVSIRTVDRLIADGDVRARRLRGKAVRILRSELESYLSGGQVAAPRAHEMKGRNS